MPLSSDSSKRLPNGYTLNTPLSNLGSSVATFALLLGTLANVQSALADSNNSSGHPSVMSIPSMGEDFVRPPDLNSGNLSQPRPTDFRYMKMNYATSKGDPDAARDDAEPTGPPPGKMPPPKAGEPGAGNPPERPPIGTPGSRSDKFGTIDLTPLNLTAEQKQKIQEMRHETGKKLKDLRKTLKTKKDDLFNATFDPDISEAAIRDKRETVRTLHNQVEDLMFDDLMGLRNILTAEQKKHLAEIKPPAPPSGRFGEGPSRFDSMRGDARPDSLTKPSIAKSDASAKSDSGKGAGSSRADVSGKTDPLKSAPAKN